MENAYISNKFRNITISGRAACGATTLSKALVDKLNWTLINAGELVRTYMKEKSIPLEFTGKTPDQYHRKLDNFIKEKLIKENSLIVESWLSGFDAQGISGVFKIFVTCSDMAVRIDRVMNRDGLTLEQAKEHIKVREEENLNKWEKLYHTRDFWNPKLYDLVIDTYKLGPSQTLEVALRAVGFSS